MGLKDNEFYKDEVVVANDPNEVGVLHLPHLCPPYAVVYSLCNYFVK